MDFYTGTDPTDGFVDYLSLADAESLGIISTSGGQVYQGVDWTHTTPNGRPSVRTSTKKSYTHGLFIGDFAHIPDSDCGVWPAWWLFGPNWPNSGEIDIIEGVNQGFTDTITLHTAAGCTANIGGSQSTTVLTSSNCNADNGNTGCGVTTGANYGSTFNSAGGGVYALQWESSGIYVWYWPRASVPADITAGAPVTGNWGTPIVAFNSGSNCVIDDYFENNNIILDTTFCGDWAGTVWSTGSCASLASSCNTYVEDNPAAFEYAYWLVNSIKVYK